MSTQQKKHLQNGLASAFTHLFVNVLPFSIAKISYNTSASTTSSPEKAYHISYIDIHFIGSDAIAYDFEDLVR